MPNPNLPIAGDYNVYVGARYVPLIMGQWSETVAYEPLSIVVFEGNSYTSRTFVPVGVPVTNETYWAATGNYNAQVEQYRQEVVEVKNSLGEIETNVSNIGDKVSILTNKKIVFFGDSYATRPEISFIDLFSQYGNFEVVNLAQSGYGFNGTSKFINILNQQTSDSSVTDVIVQSGTNDLNYNSGLKDSIRIFYEKAHSLYPNATMWLGFSAYNTINTYTSTNLFSTTLSIYQECEEFNVRYMNGIENVLHKKSYMASDNFHPSNEGAKALAHGFYNAYTTGSVDVVYPRKQVSVTEKPNVELPMYETYRNGIFNLEIPFARFDGQNVSFTTNQPSLICNVELDYAQAYSNYDYAHGSTIAIVDISTNAIVSTGSVKYCYLNNTYGLYYISRNTISLENKYYMLVGLDYMVLN